MGWVERRWRHVVLLTVLSSTVVSTVVAAAPAVAGPKVPGMDVSKYQGRIRWSAVATTPVRFVIIRATMGNDYRDRRYRRNVEGARQHGLTVGAYHFAKPSLARADPWREADHFLDVAGVRAGDVVPVLDIEETGGLSPRQLRSWASAWLARVYARTGVRAMIYSGNFFWHGFMRNTPRFARQRHPLWVAHWYVGAPDVPGGRWAGRGYTVWQYSASGRIAGIDGPVDRDWMRGSLEEGTIASLGVQPAEGGVITTERIACGGRLGWCSRLVNPGDEITFRAIPGEDQRLIRWTGACAPAGDARTCTVEAFGAETLSAIFGHPIVVAAPSAPSPAPAASASPIPPPEPSPTPEPSPESATPTPEPTAGRGPDPDSAPHDEAQEGDGDGTRFSWSRRKDRDSIGGSYRWERRGSSSISFNFRGGSVTLFTVEGRGMGKARISIDDEPVTTIDGYAPRFRTGVRHRFTGLGAGRHRLTIVPLGKKHPGATDRRVSVDALRWGGRLHPDPKPEAVSWATVHDPRASEGGYVVSDAPGAEAELEFSGTSLTLRTLRGPARGRAEIWVDGHRTRTIDLYAIDRRYVSILVASGLAEGPHTARVVVLGTHRRASEGSGVAIDRWVVTYRAERGRRASDLGPHVG